MEEAPAVRRLWLNKSDEVDGLYWIDFILPFEVEVGLDVGDKATWTAVLQHLDESIDQYRLRRAANTPDFDVDDDWETWSEELEEA